jgi:hypothetical protein
MFGYGRVVGALLAVMCLARFLIAAASYFFPETTLALYDLPAAGKTPLVYFIQVWAVRDMVLAVLVAFAARDHLLPLVSACIVIEVSDAVSALRGYHLGIFQSDDLMAQLVTVGVAFIPEFIAVCLILRQRHLAVTAGTR